jgi:hypothetical protein
MLVICRTSIAACVVFCGLAVGASHGVAATLETASGPVFVSAGRGFQAAVAPVSLKPGDTVMARMSGTADVVFDDGCRVHVDALHLLTVGSRSRSGSLKDDPIEASPCQAAGDLSNASNGTAANASGVPGGPPAGPGLPLNPQALIGMTAVGAAVGTAVWLHQGDRASP